MLCCCGHVKSARGLLSYFTVACWPEYHACCAHNDAAHSQIFRLDFANTDQELRLAGGAVQAPERFSRLCWGPPGVDTKSYPVRSGLFGKLHHCCRVGLLLEVQPAYCNGFKGRSIVILAATLLNCMRAAFAACSILAVGNPAAPSPPPGLRQWTDRNGRSC